MENVRIKIETTAGKTLEWDLNVTSTQFGILYNIKRRVPVNVPFNNTKWFYAQDLVEKIEAYYLYQKAEIIF